MTRSRSASSPPHLLSSPTADLDAEYTTMAQRLAAIHNSGVAQRGQTGKDESKAESNKKSMKQEDHRNTPSKDQLRSKQTSRPAPKAASRNDTVHVGNETVQTTTIPNTQTQTTKTPPSSSYSSSSPQAATSPAHTQVLNTLNSLKHMPKKSPNSKKEASKKAVKAPVKEMDQAGDISTISPEELKA